MDWAELAYPHLFPSHRQNEQLHPYTYRFYPESGNYLGVAGDTIYVLGPVSGGSLLEVGKLAEFACQVLPAECASADALPRLEAHFASWVARDARGRLLIFGGNQYTTLADGTFISQELRVLASDIKDMIAHDDGGVILDRQGQVTAWGRGPAVGGDADSITPFASRRLIPWPGQVKEVRAETQSPIALLNDGTVWGLSLDFSQIPRLVYSPKQLAGPPNAVSLSRGYNGTYVITSEGDVYKLGNPLTGTVPKKVEGASSVTQVLCGGIVCVALRKDGTAVKWPASASPTLVLIAKPILGPASVAQIAVAYNKGVLLDSDGHVWLWHFNDSPVPRKMQHLGEFTDISCRSNDYCILRNTAGEISGTGYLSSTSVYPSRRFGPDYDVEMNFNPVKLPGVSIE